MIKSQVEDDPQSPSPHHWHSTSRSAASPYCLRMATLGLHLLLKTMAKTFQFPFEPRCFLSEFVLHLEGVRMAILQLHLRGGMAKSWWE